MRNKRFPKYPDDSDYNTNSSSYYDDLARKQKLIKLLAEKIWEYENTLNETLEQIETRLTDYILQNDLLMTERLENWDKRIDEMPEEMRPLFVTWLNDGTLEQIINHDVLGNKADKFYVDDLNETVEGLKTGLGETFNTFNELVNAYPSGDTKDHVVAETGHRYYWNDGEWNDGGLWNAIAIAENSITPEKITEVNIVNKFNPKAVIHDNVSFPNHNGALYPMPNLAVSDFIPIKPNKKYTISNQQQNNLMTLWGSTTQDYLGFIEGDGTNTEPLTFEIENQEVKYVRVNVQNAKFPIDKFMFVEGEELPSEYVTFGYKIEWLKVEYKDIENKPPTIDQKLSGKRFFLFGDSITALDGKPALDGTAENIKGYPSYLREELGINTVNLAVGGYTIPQICETVKQTNLSSADEILITGGTNDRGQLVEVGSIGSKEDTTFDTSTTIGALRSAIKHVYENYPHVKIRLMTPIKMPNVNMESYADAIREVGKMYGIPTISLDYNVQINFTNQDYYLFDGVHPNNRGYVLLKDVIIPFLMNS